MAATNDGALCCGPPMAASDGSQRHCGQVARLKGALPL